MGQTVCNLLDPCPGCREGRPLPLAAERVDPCPGCREGFLEGFSLPVFWTHCQVVMRIFVSASRDPVCGYAQSENSKQSPGWGVVGLEQPPLLGLQSQQEPVLGFSL